MSVAAIIANTVAVTKLVTVSDSDPRLLFRQCDKRRKLEDAPEMASDGLFEVVPSPVTEVLARHAISDNIRNIAVTVKVAYFIGGGDAAGGDRLSINARAVDEMIRLLGFLENPERYDAQVTGIRTRDGEYIVSMGERMAYVDATFQVEWEQVEDVRAVA